MFVLFVLGNFSWSLNLINKLWDFFLGKYRRRGGRERGRKGKWCINVSFLIGVNVGYIVFLGCVCFDFLVLYNII